MGRGGLVGDIFASGPHLMHDQEFRIREKRMVPRQRIDGGRRSYLHGDKVRLPTLAGFVKRHLASQLDRHAQCLRWFIACVFISPAITAGVSGFRNAILIQIEHRMAVLVTLYLIVNNSMRFGISIVI
jgi:hypothetical protein